MPRDEEDALVIRIPGHLLRELLTKKPMSRDDAPGSSTFHGPAPESRRDDRPWSDAQRRLLYRLLHARGHRGPKVRTFIEDALGLGDGDTPSITDASKLIDRLKREDEGGSRGAA
ncbi:MAG: hypothetical protein OEY14_05730 [Myxococcales bacterium]|nr:hypothetical protein [Myxococcales bacterium]